MGWRSRHVVSSRPRGAAAFRYLAPGASQVLFECEKLLFVYFFTHPSSYKCIILFIQSIRVKYNN